VRKKNLAPVNLTVIIDDDPLYTFGIKRLIEVKQLSKKVETFKNGKEALGYLSQQSAVPTNNLPDIILVDINMPIMDGWTFMQEFQKLKPQLSGKMMVVMVTSSIDHNDFQRVKNFPEIRDYIIKPVTGDNLDDILSKYWQNP
jgi:YesN/AraC family two-component response regulator